MSVLRVKNDPQTLNGNCEIPNPEILNVIQRVDYNTASFNKNQWIITTPTFDYIPYKSSDPAKGRLVSRELLQKTYELKDHLGNVCVTVSDRKAPYTAGVKYSYTANLLCKADYYPFGMQMVRRTTNTGGYRYGFQGLEKDDEIKGEGNSINYKYRMHDPRVGRFFAVDPLAGKFAWNSPPL